MPTYCMRQSLWVCLYIKSRGLSFLDFHLTARHPSYTDTHSHSLQPLFLLLLIFEWTLHECCVWIWLGFAEGCVLICCSVFSSCALCCLSVLVCGCPGCWFVVAVAFVIAVVASPWLVFLFPGSASRPRRQALYDAGHRRAPPVSLGQSEEKIRRGDRSAAGVFVCVWQTVYFLAGRFLVLFIRCWAS